MRSSAVAAGDSVLSSQYNNLRNDAFGGSFLLPHQQTTPDLTLRVQEGTFYIGLTQYYFAGGNSPSFTAPTTNPRIDLLTIDSAGTLARVVGTEAASPAVPAYPVDKIIICEVFNRVGQTTIRDTDTAGQGYIQRDTRPFLQEGVVKVDGAQTVNGIKTFGSIPVLPASDPTTANQATRKSYVDSFAAPTGTILIWTTNTAPAGWLLADGSAVSRTTFSILFDLIGTTYGAGDGSTTFNLPNLKGRIVVGRDAAQTEFDVLGETGGAKTHTLLESEMPAHTHAIDVVASGGALTKVKLDNISVANSGTFETLSKGGGGAHNNLQPYIALNHIIKT